MTDPYRNILADEADLNTDCRILTCMRQSSVMHARYLRIMQDALKNPKAAIVVGADISEFEQLIEATFEQTEAGCRKALEREQELRDGQSVSASDDGNVDPPQDRSVAARRRS